MPQPTDTQGAGAARKMIFQCCHAAITAQQIVGAATFIHSTIPGSAIRPSIRLGRRTMGLRILLVLCFALLGLGSSRADPVDLPGLQHDSPAYVNSPPK